MEPRVRAIPHTLWPEDVAHCFRVCGEIEQVSAAVHMALTCSLCMQSKLSGQRISHTIMMAVMVDIFLVQSARTADKKGG